MKIKISTIRTFFFMIAYEIFLFKGCFEQLSFVSEINEYLNIFVIIILFMLILTDRNNNDNYVVLLSGTVLGFIIYYITKDTTILKIFLLIYSFKKMDFKEFIKKDFYIRLTFYILVILLNQINVIEGLLGGRYVDGIKIVSRNSLGFFHPNYLGAITLSLCCEYLYLIDFKINKFKILPLVLAFYIIYFVANSRTSAYVFLVLMFLIFIEKSTNILKYKEFKNIIKSIVIICFIISIIGMIIYLKEPEVLKDIDLNIWSRFHHANNYLDTYGVSFFGNKIEQSFVNKNPLDNVYFYIIARYGVIVLLFYIIVYNNMFKSLFNCNKYGLIIILFCYCIMGLFESSVLSITINPFMFLISSNKELIKCENKKVYNKENI